MIFDAQLTNALKTAGPPLLFGLRLWASVCLALYVGFWHEGESEEGAKPVRLCPCSSDVNLFGYSKGIVNFNTEIPDGALDFRMTQQQLHGT